MLEILGRPGCVFCERAIKFAIANEYDYRYIDVTENKDALNRVIDTGRKTVPQIWLNGIHIGGYDDLVAFHRNSLQSFSR